MLGLDLGVWPMGAPQGGPVAPSPDLSSALTFNLGLSRYYASNRPFLNLAKQARNWASNSGDPVPRDADGYPTAIPSGASEVYSWIFVADEEVALLATDIHVFWDGDATLAIGDGGTNIRTPEANHIIYTPTTGPHRYESTDLGTTGISNMRVVRDDHLALFNSGEKYNPAWLSKVSKAGELRFLNWLSINSNNNLQVWATRPLEDRYTYEFSMPYEVVIDVCNRAGANLWVQFAHRVEQAFVEGVAALVRDNLDSSLTCFIEYTNETWNNGFSQSLYFIAKGAEDWGTQLSGTVSLTAGSNIVTGTGTAFQTELSPSPEIVSADGQLIEVSSIQSDTQYTSSRKAILTVSGATIHKDEDYGNLSSYVKYATQVAKWWQAIHPTRCKHLLGAQVSGSTSVQTLIDASAWQANEPGNWETRSTTFDGIAIATYYGLNVQSSAVIADLNAGAAISEAEMLSRLDGYLRDGSVTSLPGLSDKLRTHHRACRAAGLELYAYEGGSHILHPGGSVTTQERNDLLAHFETWLQSDICTTFHNDLLQVHKSYVDGPFMQFDAVSRWSNEATWGAYEYPEQTATDKRIDFLEGLATAGRFWGSDIAPTRTTVAPPSLAASEFDTIATLQLDVCFTANATNYSAVGLPSGLSIDPTTGEITGTLPDGTSGVGTISVTASNGAGSVTADVSYTITDVAAADPMAAAYDGIVYIDPSEASSITAASPPALDTIVDRLGGINYNANFYIPQTGVNSLNGHNVITAPSGGARFYGGVPRQVKDLIGGGDAFAMYALYRRTNGPSVFSYVFGFGANANQFSLFSDNGGKVRFNLETATGTHFVRVTPGGSDSDWRMVKVIYDGATLSMDVGGVTGSKSVTGNVVIGADTQTLCASTAGTNRLTGDIASVFIADRAYGSTEQAAMLAFFNSKFGL